jgi:hypothetical protein
MADHHPSIAMIDKEEGAMARDVKGEPVEAIQAFLRATDHGPDHWEDQYHGTLDPALRPRPDKRYPTLAPLPLPPVAELAPSDPPALTVIADAGAIGTTSGRTLDLEVLARLVYFTNGITKTIRRGDEAMAFRAAPTTGALYHLELYLVTGDLPGLPAGVYHYGAHDHAQRLEVRRARLPAYLLGRRDDAA